MNQCSPCHRLVFVLILIVAQLYVAVLASINLSTGYVETRIVSCSPCPPFLDFKVPRQANMSFCILGIAAKGKKNKLYILQMKALRIIGNLPYSAHT